MAISPQVNVPERNRAIKKLLEKTYPGAKVSVTAGNGTAYHWVYIAFKNWTDKLVPLPDTGSRTDAIAKLIRAEGIYLSEFPVSDCGQDHGMLPCINLTMPRAAA